MNLKKYHFRSEMIRKALNNKGKSQAELARYLGMANNTIVNIFKSDKIRIDILQRIAEFLDVSISEFFVNENGETFQEFIDNTLKGYYKLIDKLTEENNENSDKLIEMEGKYEDLEEKYNMSKEYIKTQGDLIEKYKIFTKGILEKIEKYDISDKDSKSK